MSNKDKLFYYSKSKDVGVGCGIGEVVINPSNYSELNKYKNWRRVLSNFYECAFVFDEENYGDGYQYRTVEHCFQAQKIALVDKELAYRFTMNSGNEIGLGNGNVARKNRKIIILNSNVLEKWNDIHENVMKAINLCKYNQCEQFMKVLNLTHTAELWHIVMRSSVRLHSTYLEEIRDNHKHDTINKPSVSNEKVKSSEINVDRKKILKGRKGYTVVELKEFLKALNLPVSGKKDDLVDRLNNKLDSIKK